MVLSVIVISNDKNQYYSNVSNVHTHPDDMHPLGLSWSLCSPPFIPTLDQHPESVAPVTLTTLVSEEVASLNIDTYIYMKNSWVVLMLNFINCYT